MSETKTRGETLRECVRRVVGNRDAREVFTNDGERAAAFDAIAAEYDKARFALPEDVEAFVAEVEARGPIATVEPCGAYGAKCSVFLNLGNPLDSRWLHYFDVKEWADEAASRINAFVGTGRLIAIVRGQRGRILDLEADNRAVYAERDALTDRLEKLETCIVCGCGLLPSNDPPHCEDSCIVSDEQRSEWDEIRAKWSVR